MSEWNNNSANPEYSPVCGSATEGDGYSSNYQLTYRSWFEDDTGPTSMPTPVMSDDSIAGVLWDNDTRFDAAYNQSVDGDTGIAGYHINVYDITAGATIHTASSVGTDRNISMCSAACDLAVTPVHNHQYRVRVRATNGSYPTISNARTLWSSYAYVSVDLVNPVSSIVAPASGSWQRVDFTADFTDTDSGAGVDSASCRWRVLSSGTQLLPWTSRACSGSRTVTVGPSAYCRNQGTNTCLVYGDSDDLARRGSNTTSRTFSIDWSGDTINSLTARTVSGGTVIGTTSWTADRDPFIEFGVDTGARYAPISGYSFDVDATPDCLSLETTGGDTGSTQLPPDMLDEGVHTFGVRAVDAAGNCGPVAYATVQVDYTPDPVTGLEAFTQFGGTAITSGAWQQDRDPYVSWTPASSTAPIVGYSVGTGSVTDCTVDATATSTTLSSLPDGITTFWVRAVDAASNCGPASFFEIWVDTTCDAVTGLAALDQAGGTAITPGVWQWDNDPYLTWSASTSTAPIVGYSLEVDGTPACASTQTETYHAFATDSIGEGIHHLRVAAVDAAGNCCAPAEFELWVASQPTAVVGADQTVYPSVVTLDGSGSHAVGSATITYHWSADAGNPAPVTFGDNDSETAEQTQVVLRKAGMYTFGLAVNDGNWTSPEVETRVTVRNVVPVPWANPVQVVHVSNQVALSGRWTSDANDDTLTFAWTQTGGPSVTLAAADTSSPNFWSPDQPAVLVFAMTASDGALQSDPAHAVVVVLADPNTVCVADAGQTQVVEVTDQVTLFGTSLCDVLEADVEYGWMQTGGTPVVLMDADQAEPYFVAPSTPDVLTFTLTASNGTTDSPPVTVQVVVNDTASAFPVPVADAGATQTVTLFTAVHLDGSASVVASTHDASYLWRQTDGPWVLVEDLEVVNPQFVPIEPGRYEFALTVADDGVRSVEDRVAVFVVEPGWDVPVASAGADRQVLVGDALTLDGSGSTVDASGVAGYTWWQIAGPWAELTMPRSVSPGVTAHTVGRYVFRLEVDDGVLRSEPEDVVIQAGEEPLPDGGVSDAGPGVDASDPVDAGDGVDAGDATGRPSGCGCRHTGTAPPSGLLFVLFAFGILWRRRRCS